MNCKFDKKLLYSYADNTIGPLERIFVEEHLKYCDRCVKDLNLIKVIDNSLKESINEIEFPDRLSLITELIVENCMAEIEENNLKLRINNIIESYKHGRKSIKYANKLYENNPYNKFIQSSVNNAISYVKKPVKGFFKKKLNSMKIFNLKKIG